MYKESRVLHVSVFLQAVIMANDETEEYLATCERRRSVLPPRYVLFLVECHHLCILLTNNTTASTFWIRFSANL